MQQIFTTGRGILNDAIPSSFGFLRHYLLNPLKSGLFGYGIYFSFLLAAKYLGVVLGTRDFFLIDVLDVAISGLGFLLFSLIRFLENFRDGEESKGIKENSKAA